MLAVQLLPLLCIVLLLLLPLALLLLGLDCQLFKLVTVHFHVGADDTVRNCGNCCIPVLVLAAVEEAFYDDWVSLRHVVLD